VKSRGQKCAEFTSNWPVHLCGICSRKTGPLTWDLEPQNRSNYAGPDNLEVATIAKDKMKTDDLVLRIRIFLHNVKVDVD